MTKRVISTEKAPKAIGPYSQAIAVKPTELVYCSGQIPLDPATGQVVQQGE
jgi:2-iminobutanoate/2-iminopropanoate deaminase